MQNEESHNEALRRPQQDLPRYTGGHVAWVYFRMGHGMMAEKATL